MSKKPTELKLNLKKCSFFWCRFPVYDAELRLCRNHFNEYQKQQNPQAEPVVAFAHGPKKPNKRKKKDN